MSSAITLSRNILTAAIEQHASDIHFYPFNTETDIFFRINGKRVFYKKISTNHYQLLLTYYKFSSGMDIGETRKPQNGTIQHHDTSMIYSLRFSTLPTNQLESLAVRVLPQKQTHSLNELFLFPSQYKQIKKMGKASIRHNPDYRADWKWEDHNLIFFSSFPSSGRFLSNHIIRRSHRKRNARYYPSPNQ